jgi:hypothetical protein
MATVTAQYNWISGETVTPAKLNSTAAPTVVVANNEITTAKILDGAVTNAKVASGLDAAKLTTGTVSPDKLSQPLTQDTEQLTTSGTSFDFFIPSWAKKITVALHQLSTTTTSEFFLRIGDSSGISITGYESSACNQVDSVTASSTGFTLGSATSSSSVSGIATLCNVYGNVWVNSFSLQLSAAGGASFGGGSKTLTGALETVRLTTKDGHTFDKGSVNVIYEG